MKISSKWIAQVNEEKLSRAKLVKLIAEFPDARIMVSISQELRECGGGYDIGEVVSCEFGRWVLYENRYYELDEIDILISHMYNERTIGTKINLNDSNQIWKECEAKAKSLQWENYIVLKVY